MHFELEIDVFTRTDKFIRIYLLRSVDIDYLGDHLMTDVEVERIRQRHSHGIIHLVLLLQPALFVFDSYWLVNGSVWLHKLADLSDQFLLVLDGSLVDNIKHVVLDVPIEPLRIGYFGLKLSLLARTFNHLRHIRVGLYPFVVEHIRSELIVVKARVELRMQIGLLVDVHHDVVLHLVVLEELRPETHLVGDAHMTIGEESQIEDSRALKITLDLKSKVILLHLRVVHLLILLASLLPEFAVVDMRLNPLQILQIQRGVFIDHLANHVGRVVGLHRLRNEYLLIVTELQGEMVLQELLEDGVGLWKFEELRDVEHEMGGDGAAVVVDAHDVFDDCVRVDRNVVDYLILLEAFDHQHFVLGMQQLVAAGGVVPHSHSEVINIIWGLAN